MVQKEYTTQVYIEQLNQLIIERFLSFLNSKYDLSKLAWRDFYQASAWYLHLDKASARQFIFLLANVQSLQINSQGIKFLGSETNE